MAGTAKLCCQGKKKREKCDADVPMKGWEVAVLEVSPMGWFLAGFLSKNLD
jgi:hypothetical protein